MASTCDQYDEHFGDDAGTLHVASRPSGSIRALRGEHWNLLSKRSLRKEGLGRHLLWFVDDERKNRNWFAQEHRCSFAVLTFSDPEIALEELDRGAPCDVVITDVFFPSTRPESKEQVEDLLSIYPKIREKNEKQLKRLWQDEKKKWRLKGFKFAVDVTAVSKRRGERIPVLLFSRKAPMLLSAGDWRDESSAAAEDTFWMVEKLDPILEAQFARDAAMAQAARIRAALRYRVAATPWWRRFLEGASHVKEIADTASSLVRLGSST